MGFVRTKNKSNGVSSTVQINPTKYLVHSILFRHTPSHARTGVCSSSEKSNFNIFFWFYFVFKLKIVYAKNSVYSWILLDKNTSLLTSSYEKLNHFFKILFELAPVSPNITHIYRLQIPTSTVRFLHVFIMAVDTYDKYLNEAKRAN